MSSVYLLRIDADTGDFAEISKILSVQPSSTLHSWELSIEETSPFFFKAIDYFVNLLEPNLALLLERGNIKADDISVWYLYGYQDQCNMEFSPSDLARLGKNNITLCISCWEEK